MKIVFDALQLQKKLKEVVRIIPASSKTDMHKFVRITADKEDCKVEFETTAHDVAIRQTLVDTLVQSPATILESGACLLPARELLEIIKRARDKVELTVNGPGFNTKIKFGKAEFDMNGSNPEVFAPYRNDPEETSRIEITALALRSLLEQTTYACSSSEVRPILTGVNFTLEDGTLHAVATDGLRLAKDKAEGKTEGEAKGNITVPKVPLESMAAILPKDDDEMVTLELGNTVLVATWDDDGTRFVMRALDGNYPDVNRILPRAKTKIRVSRIELLTACERISIFAGDVENRQTRVEFDNGKMHLSIYSATAGTASDEVGYQGPENIDLMMFNIRYWLDLLKAFKSDEIEIGIVEQNQPITVQPVDGETIALLSPILYREPSDKDTKQTA